MISIPKGTKDILPKDVYKWQLAEETFRKVFHSEPVRYEAS